MLQCYCDTYAGGVWWYCQCCETKAWAPSLSNGQVGKEEKWDLSESVGHQDLPLQTVRSGWEKKSRVKASLIWKKKASFFLGKRIFFFLLKNWHWCSWCMINTYKSLSSGHFSHHGFLPPCICEVSLPWKQKCYWGGLVHIFVMFWCRIWTWTGYLLKLKMQIQNPSSSNNATTQNKVLSEYYLCRCSSGGCTAHRNLENRPLLHFSLNHFWFLSTCTTFP